MHEFRYLFSDNLNEFNVSYERGEEWDKRLMLLAGS